MHHSSLSLTSDLSYIGAVLKLERVLTTDQLPRALILHCRLRLCHCHSEVASWSLHWQ